MFPYLDDLLYLVENTVLPIKNLEVDPFDGVISFGTTRTFFNRRWNATRGRWFMFFNSLTQLPASLSDVGIRTLLATKPIYAARAFLNRNRTFGSDEEFPEGDVGPKRSNNTVELEHYMQGRRRGATGGGGQGGDRPPKSFKKRKNLKYGVFSCIKMSFSVIFNK